MAASIRILKAEKLVKDIGEYADKIVFPTDKAKEQFEGIASADIEDKCIVSPQGIYNIHDYCISNKKQAKKKLNELFGIPENSIVLLGIGSINFGKGVDQLIPTLLELQKHADKSIAEDIYKNDLDYHVIWLGNVSDPAYLEWLSVEIKNAGLEHLWHWAGFIRDKALYYDIMFASDVFVLPSREDTYPSVALDAASVALPIAAFESSGGGADIASKQHGLMAQSADIVDYSRLILYLTSHYEIHEKCVDYASKVREDHDFSNYCKAIESFLL